MMDFTPVVLMAMANDTKQSLRLRDEEREIRDILADAHDENRVEFISLGHTILDDMVGSLNRFHRRVAIFHFSGHSNGRALLLEDGTAQSAQLSKLLGMAPAMKLVFLNGCSNQAQVEKLHAAGVKCVIATSAPIEDNRALYFARNFYEALSYGKSIKQAFETATAYIRNNDPRFKTLITRDFVVTISKSNEVPEMPWGLYYQQEEAIRWHLPLEEQLGETITRDEVVLGGGIGMDETIINPKASFSGPGKVVGAIELETTDRRVKNAEGVIRIEGNVLMGRHPACDIVILSKSVSRKHAQLHVESGQIYLTDQQSTNGTYWNDTRVSRMPIKEDGILRLDDVIFKVRVSKS